MLPSARSDIQNNWSTAAGVLFALIYFTLWSVDMAVFILRKMKLYYYTLLTLSKKYSKIFFKIFFQIIFLNRIKKLIILVGRIVSGILINIYASSTIDISVAWIWLFLSITLLFAILKALNEDSVLFVYHAINFFVILIGGLILALGSQDINNYYNALCCTFVFLYQISVFHELALVRYLYQLPMKEWEQEFVHLAPRVAFYVKKFYTEQRYGNEIDIEDF